MNHIPDVEPNPFAAPESDLTPEKFSQGEEQSRYAGFATRFIAAFIDGAILELVLLGVGLSLRGLAGGDEYSPLMLVFQVLSCIVAWMYFALQESSAAMATVGKRIMGIRVVTLADERISFSRAAGRTIAKIVSWVPLWIGFFIQPITRHKQTLHDLMAGTIVIKVPKP